MLQFVKDWMAGVRHRLSNLWEERFKYGLHVLGASGYLYRYSNGANQFNLTLLQFTSPGTGHWPFTVFEFSTIGGDRATIMITLLGVCYGQAWVHDLDEDGTVAGPDYRKSYLLFSCINHRNQDFEEII